ncbi:DUF2306 domain-containing protein [Algibacillus agarilyticus]|uniref:DUF2306 domain-containing protein n=1 Tax=Algibacillus agarilyticus TaxID=2234133 RepID=UPI000DD072DF|nr:DUF2306 domain-containing protein [Algibacillus agarilyticus]
MIEFVHICLGFLSLFTGLYILFTRKGNRKHKLVGRVYFISMLGLNLTSFGIYKLFNGWGIFHWMAVASLIPLIAGYIAIIYKNINAHYYFMCWSYIGLLCATISEIFVHVPMATRLLNSINHIDTILMLCLIGSGFYFLPRKQHLYTRKT